jgi:rhodanese-related sulfurtransferase
MADLARAARQRDTDPQSVPSPAGEPDLVTVDTTWGRIQPLQPVPGIATVGELEIADLVKNGAQLVDTRVPDSRSGATIAGAINVPHDQVLERRAELDPDRISILFCNGPQCPQTPDALRTLADSGYRLDRLAYYRGGLHDWITLAMPTESV